MRNLQMILLSLMMVMAVCICLLCNASAYQVERASEADKPTVAGQDVPEVAGNMEPAPEETIPPEAENGSTEPEETEEMEDIPEEECPGHEWEYAYGADGDEADIYYFRYCIYCGYTEDLDDCPPELEWTLPDDGTGQEEPEEIPDEEVTDEEESEPETDPADESGDSSAEMEG